MLIVIQVDCGENETVYSNLYRLLEKYHVFELFEHVARTPFRAKGGLSWVKLIGFILNFLLYSNNFLVTCDVNIHV